MVLNFKRKKTGKDDTDKVFSLIKIGDEYQFSNSSIYFTQNVVTALLDSGLWILEE